MSIITYCGQYLFIGNIVQSYIKLIVVLLMLVSTEVASNYDDCLRSSTSKGSQKLHHGQEECGSQTFKDSATDEGIPCVACVNGHLLSRKCYKFEGSNQHQGKSRLSNTSICYSLDGYPNTRGEPEPLPTEDCNTYNCKLPDCFCHGGSPNISRSALPMFVAITFDDSINHDRYNSQFRPFFVDNDYNLYNPNGCGLKTTLFVSLDAGDISLVKTLWDAGNEIAGHTLAHSLPVGSSEDDYIPTIEAIDGMRKKLLEEIGDSQLVNSIIGFRAPYLRVAEETQYKVLKDLGFLYDSSLVSTSLYRTKKPIWPYTLNYRNTEGCDNWFCPEDSYSGFWEIPLNAWIGDDGFYCWMLDGCTVGQSKEVATVKQWFDYFQRNFEPFYETKTPMSFYTHANMFDFYPNAFPAFVQWLKHVTRSYKDVWFVTLQQLLFWMKSPMSHEQMLAKNWGC
ncbi:hypothetical protein BgiMline_011500 [Biomphalaria glabrata]|nr:chitin deacetylase 8 [Biomphalaria glabrata]